MEDLFKNFSEHVGKMLSPKLENEIKLYLSRKLINNSNIEDYSEIENDIKNIMAIYFQSATDRDYLEMSTNLYNSYVETDDKNIIQAIKYFIRVYSYYENIRLQKILYKWRINAFKLKMQSNEENTQFNNTNKNTKSSSTYYKKKYYNK